MQLPCPPPLGGVTSNYHIISLCFLYSYLFCRACESGYANVRLTTAFGGGDGKLDNWACFEEFVCITAKMTESFVKKSLPTGLNNRIPPPSECQEHSEQKCPKLRNFNDAKVWAVGLLHSSALITAFRTPFYFCYPGIVVTGYCVVMDTNKWRGVTCPLGSRPINPITGTPRSFVDYTIFHLRTRIIVIQAHEPGFEPVFPVQLLRVMSEVITRVPYGWPAPSRDSLFMTSYMQVQTLATHSNWHTYHVTLFVIYWKFPI